MEESAISIISDYFKTKHDRDYLCLTIDQAISISGKLCVYLESDMCV